MMIVTPDDKHPSDVKIPTEAPLVSEEPPPSYSPHPELVASGSDPVSPSLGGTFKTKPTNHLVLSNDNDAIRGEFVIDPSISIPSTLLPPLTDGESEADRKNLSLTSKNSSVKARIWLLGQRDAGAKLSRRTTIALASHHGSVHATLHTLDGAAPFSLTATAHHGGVKLAIPQSFQGLISLSTRHGSVSLSDALIQNGTQLSQVGDARRYFIGDFQLLGEDEWQGDQMEISSVHGSIRLKYVEEEQEEEGKGKGKGLFSRLFRK